jgi:hypothetical protein
MARQNRYADPSLARAAEQYLAEAGRSEDLTHFTTRHSHFWQRYVSAVENIVG